MTGTARTRPHAVAAALIALALLLALAPASTDPANAQLLPGCAIPGVDDRCERWTVVHDPQPDPDRPFQQPSALALGPDGTLAIAAGYTAEDLFDTQGQARSAWRFVATDVADGEIRWVTDPGPTDAYARPLDVVVDADGATAYAIGYAASAFGSLDAVALVVALDTATGAVRWTRQLDAAALDLDDRDDDADDDEDQGEGDDEQPAGDVRGWRIAPAADGLLAVVATVRRDGQQDLVVATLEAATGELRGTLLEVGAVAGSIAVPRGLAVSPDGLTAYVGATTAGLGLYDLDVLALAVDLADPADPADPTAPEVRWRVRGDWAGGRAPDQLAAMALTEDGSHLLLTGRSGEDVDGPPFDADYVAHTTALRTADGAVGWAVRDDLGVTVPDVRDIALAADRVVVVGSRQVAGALEGVVAAYDLATGAPAWQRSVATPGMDREGLAAVAGTADALVVGGASASTVGDTAVPGSAAIRDALVVGLDPADGSTLWSARHNATDVGDDAITDLVMTPDGGAIALGRVTRNVEQDRNFYDLALLAYDR